ncbi:helix-turn-helix transcriptional regulator [Paenibacillus sp. S3N08]|uniref:Helix-turn-helix transcriptional regulator n=2 Tax=Paenibacillus agricola TaxID=2716264 RepID=A0ABX0J8J6_9BACL|nr:helix-turn-helix transcriptional regulator [Paenibacillus agricola]
MHAVFWHRKAKFQLKQDQYPDWVMFAVEEGSFHYRIGEVAGTAVFGDAILCPPGTLFEREVAEPVSFHFITLGWQAQPYAGSLDQHHPSGDPELPVHLTWTDGNRLSSTYLYIHQLGRLQDEQRSLLWNHYLQDLWQQYRVEHDLAKSEHRQQQKQRQLDPAMLKAAGWLQQHAFKQVALRELGASLDLSPVQFSRKFQAAYGTTPMDYLTAMRIQKAQTLLLETEMTLEQIAERCGYENGFYLSRMFSKKKGISPSLYRNMHRV